MTDHSAQCNEHTWLSQVMHAAVKKSTCVVMSRDIQILSSDCVPEWKQFAHFFSKFSPFSKESFDRIRYGNRDKKKRQKEFTYRIVVRYLLGM